MSSIEKSKSKDLAISSLICGTKTTDVISAKGHYTFECVGPDGKLKWREEEHNLVVDAGLYYLLGVALKSTTQITSWYLGLYGAAASNNPAAADTMSSHAGWTEITPYSNATRIALTFSSIVGSGIANTTATATFNINSTATVGGAFCTSGSVKAGTTGTLLSAVDFSAPGDRVVASGDTLNVTYSFSISA